MEFNALLKTHLLPILQRHGFKLTEELKNILRFQSSESNINFAHNDYDNSHIVEIGKEGGIFYPVNNYAVKKYFDSALSIEQVTIEVFVQNISILLETKEGIEFLKGNIAPLKEIVEKQSEDYTSELIQKQTLDNSLRNWAVKDYVAFIKNVEEIGIVKLPQSYQLKYKIALEKLRNG